MGIVRDVGSEDYIIVYNVGSGTEVLKYLGFLDGLGCWRGFLRYKKKMFRQN